MLIDFISIIFATSISYSAQVAKSGFIFGVYSAVAIPSRVTVDDRSKRSFMFSIVNGTIGRTIMLPIVKPRECIWTYVNENDSRMYIPSIEFGATLYIRDAAADGVDGIAVNNNLKHSYFINMSGGRAYMPTRATMSANPTTIGKVTQDTFAGGMQFVPDDVEVWSIQ